jgi:hypothetical protein
LTEHAQIARTAVPLEDVLCDLGVIDAAATDEAK